MGFFKLMTRFVGAYRVLWSKSYKRIWTNTRSIQSDCPRHSIEINTDKKISNSGSRRQILETWNLNLVGDGPGRLSVKFPFNIKIEPVDSATYPAMDRAFIQLYSETDKNISAQNVDMGDYYRMTVSHRHLDKDINISGGLFETIYQIFGRSIPLKCAVQIPVQLDLDINITGGGHVEIDNVESRSISICSDAGNITLNNVNCHGPIKVTSQSGDVITTKSLVGNIELATGAQGALRCDKLQGRQICCSSHDGPISVKALYSATASIVTDGGAVQVGSSHGDVRLSSQSGCVDIESVDGSLGAELGQGSLTAGLTRYDTVSVCTTGGNVTLTVPESTSSRLSLSGVTVEIHPSLERCDYDHMTNDHLQRVRGETTPGAVAKIHASSAKGRVQIMVSDWISSLNLKASERLR